MKKTTFIITAGLLFVACNYNSNSNSSSEAKETASAEATAEVLWDAVTDYDGNTYDAIRIGNQVWMLENLKTTHYADGTPIEEGFFSEDTPNWSYPDSDSTNKDEKGLLYNWLAVMHNSSSSSSKPSGIQGICPDGWHVPSDAEWKQMEMTVGISPSEVDSIGWRGDIAHKLCKYDWSDMELHSDDPDLNASGFCAVPAGDNSILPNCYLEAYFWTCTQRDGDSAYARQLTHTLNGVERMSAGFPQEYSVRCVRN